MRIIHANKYWYLRGGAERYLLSLTKMLEARGHVVAPFAMRYPKNQPTAWDKYFPSEILTEEGIGNIGLSLRQVRRSLWSGEAQKKMNQLIGVFQPDVVHIHNIYTHLSPSILSACKKHRVPVVMTVHDYALISSNYSLWDGQAPIDPSQASFARVVRSRYIKGSLLASVAQETITRLHRSLRLYDRYIDQYLVSSSFAKEALVANGYDDDKIIIKPLFVDSPLGESKKTDDGFMLYAGRLEKYKGVETLIEAAKINQKIKIKIAGQGPDEQRLRALARGLGNVEFVGFVESEQLWNLMRLARAVVVPSLWDEVFGLVAVEAMAQGTPVVVSDRGGLQEIPEHGKSGTIFTAGDARELANVLETYRINPSLAIEQGAQAINRAAELANPEDYLDFIEELYRSLVDNFR